MRVIAGSLRRRTLEAPRGLDTRPTSDRLRETLFNILTPRIEGASFLDLYAGSGAVGIEALSRGARRVICVERAHAALKVLRANLDRLGLRNGIAVENGSVIAYLRRERANTAANFEIVFLDPPYDAAGEYEAVLGSLGGAASWILSESAVVIAEHRRKEQLGERYGRLERTRLLEQGDAALSFYTVRAAEPESAE